MWVTVLVNGCEVLGDARARRRERVHATRGSVAKTPYFPETISCLVLILGETGDSGHNTSWDGDGKKATIPNEFRESSQRTSRIEIRAENAGFRDPASAQPLLRREMLCSYLPSFFQTKFPVWQ